jgi:hypothetical protein
MRDLYNRKKKLDYWTERIHTDLDEHDKRDVLKFLEIMQEKDQSILTITRCISIVIQIRKQIDKPLSKFTKEVQTLPRDIHRHLQRRLLFPDLHFSNVDN